MKYKFEALENLSSFSKQLGMFSDTIKKEDKLVYFPYRKLRISRIGEYLYLYLTKKTKKQKYLVLDIALYDPYQRSMMDHFNNYKRYLK